MILQFRFDAQTGHLTPNSPFRVEPTGRLARAITAFIPLRILSISPTSRAAGVTGYRLDRAIGTLSAVQTVTTLPDGYTTRNTCSRFTSRPRAIPVCGQPRPQRIAGFAVDATTGHLTAIGHVSTEAVPSAFSLDPAGHFVFAAGTAIRPIGFVPHQRRKRVR